MIETNWKEKFLDCTKQFQAYEESMKLYMKAVEDYCGQKISLAILKTFRDFSDKKK